MYNQTMSTDEDENKKMFIKDCGLDPDIAERASELMDEEGLDEDEATELSEVL